MEVNHVSEQLGHRTLVPDEVLSVWQRSMLLVTLEIFLSLITNTLDRLLSDSASDWVMQCAMGLGLKYSWKF